MNQKAADRLKHIDSHLKEDFLEDRIEGLQNRILSMQHNYYSLFLSLESLATAQGISIWFNAWLATSLVPPFHGGIPDWFA